MSPTAKNPELVVDGFPPRRARWIEIATSADHKDLGRVLITGALGFLFIALVELLLMRLQLAIPENTFLTPVAFNRMLSLYGATAIFLFALPLALGFFYYVTPLQIGARGTALPRVGQLGTWLFVAGATVLYTCFLFTPSEAGVNPLPPLSGIAFLPNNGVDAWAAAMGLVTLGFVLIAVDLIATLRRLRAPGMAWRRLPVFSWAAAISSSLLLAIGPVMLAAITMLLIDRNFDGIFFAGDAGGSPLLWQHLSWIFYTGAYMLVLIFALGAIAEIVPAQARKPLFNRGAVIGSLIAIAVLGTLAWIQNMYTAPIGVGWMYFAMVMALALIVPFGLIFFNLIATLAGGAVRMRAPLLFAAGAIAMIALGLASEVSHSLVALGWRLQHTTDSTAATHFALVGGVRLRRLRRAALVVPEDDRPHDGRDARPLLLLDDDARHPARLRAALLCRRRRGPGDRRLQVLRRDRRHRLQPDRDDRDVRARRRDPDHGRQRDPEPRERRPRRARRLGRRLARVVRALAARAAQLRRPAGRAQRPPAARHPRRDRASQRARRAAGPRVAAGSLSGHERRPDGCDRAARGRAFAAA